MLEQEKRRQLKDEGYCLFEDVREADLLARGAEPGGPCLLDAGLSRCPKLDMEAIVGITLYNRASCLDKER